MATISPSVNTSPYYSKQLRSFAIKALLSLFTLIFLIAYLLPMGNMVLVSLSNQAQLSVAQNGSVIPMAAVTYNYQGKDIAIYKVPFDTGVRELARVKGVGGSDNGIATFVDPAHPEAGEITWHGNWRVLEPVQKLSLHPENFGTAWEEAKFPRMFGNTIAIAIAGMIGTLLSSTCVAYAFARFPIPGKNILFMVLIGTIILPTQVTLIPTYAFWSKLETSLGFSGPAMWAPLIVPHFFANAYNVFLLRQYFLTLPRELDEAAMIDGAGPFKILTRVLLPQAWPVLIAVAIFHFIFAWNDFFSPLIYLLNNPELQPISVGVQQFNFQYGPHPELIQATSLMAMILPLIIFFAAQRVFMRGVVITGVEK